MAGTRRHALIVGASRGLGLGLVEIFLARGWRVTATQRRPSTGLEALRSDALSVETVDIDDDDSVDALRDRLSGDRFDLVFVNAGVATQADEPLHAIPREVVAQVYQTNAVSPIRFAEAFADRMASSGLVAFMSSRLGSVALNMTGGWEIYRASKAALNSFARSFEARHRGASFGVLVLHPGWVRTDMGGAGADLDVGTSVTGMTDVIESRLGARTIAFVDYRGETLAW